MPKRSLPDGNILGLKRVVTRSTQHYFFMAIDFHTSETRSDALIGNSYDLDTFQLTSVIGTQGVLYRPTISDIVRVRKGQ